MSSFTNISAPSVGDPTKQALIQGILDDLVFLNGQLVNATGGLKIINGSFESDVNGDGVPDNWVLTPSGSGGTNAIDATVSTAGTNSMKFTSPGGGGNGGGILTSADFFEVTPGRPFLLSYQIKSSVANVTNQVQIYWYKGDQTASATASQVVHLDAATNPTAWRMQTHGAIPPSDARFAKIEITGCQTGNTTAGSTWFDDVQIQPLPSLERYVEYSAAGSYNFVAQSTTALVDLIAGGGGGGGAGGASFGGTGGLAGNRAISLVTGLTIGTAYTVTIGAGGASGSAGNDSTFNSTVVVAKGGSAGLANGVVPSLPATGTGQIIIQSFLSLAVATNLGSAGADSVRGGPGGQPVASAGTSGAGSNNGAGGGGAGRASGVAGAGAAGWGRIYTL